MEEMSLRCRVWERRDALVALGVLLVSAKRAAGAGADWCGPVDFRFFGELEWSARQANLGKQPIVLTRQKRNERRHRRQELSQRKS
jgi:hypothetical protein